MFFTKRIFIKNTFLIVFFWICQVQASASNSVVPPYSIDRYKPVLNQAKLQAPTSVDLITQGNFIGKHNQYFYIDNSTGWMTFQVTGDHHRSELRQVSDWLTSDSKFSHHMDGQVVVYKPEKGEVNEITFMQIHDVTNANNAVNKPLLRLVWLRNRNNIKNHYWAVIKEDVCEKCKNYKKIDLGKYSNKPTKFDVSIEKDKLTLKVNGSVVSALNRHNISYWGGLRSYFKAGVYNQSPGTGTVKFKELTFYNEVLK